MQPADFRDLRMALVERWGIEPPDVGHHARDALLEALARRVASLLQHDYERLLYSMYAIDVSEKDFSEAVRSPDHQVAARAVAELVLKREIEKMESRKRYGRAESPGTESVDGDPPQPLPD